MNATSRTGDAFKLRRDFFANVDVSEEEKEIASKKEVKIDELPF
jgi:hypothetical protein